MWRRLRGRPPASLAPDVNVRAARTTRQIAGGEGEALARNHLERRGLCFVAANVRYRDGELDLVMREAQGATTTLVFVEVRRRARASHGGALASVTPSKRRRLIVAAAHYLVALDLRTLPACRFDLVTIDTASNGGLRVEWLRDAFRDDG